MLVRMNVVVWSALLVLSGCGSLHLYSPARDEQGKAAQKAWADVDSLGTISVQRENSAKLLAKELAYVEGATLVGRDLRFLALVSGPSMKMDLVDPVNTKLLAVAGDDALQQRLDAATKREASFASQYEQAILEIRRHGFEPFSCSDLTSGKA